MVYIELKMAEASSVEFKFDFGVTLPTMYDTAISIFNVSKKEGKLRNSAVIAYAHELRKQWIKAFGEKHVIAFQNMKPKITEVLTSYKKRVYIPSSQKTDKHTGEATGSQSLRTLEKIWREMQIPVKKNAKKRC